MNFLPVRIAGRGGFAVATLGGGTEIATRVPASTLPAKATSARHPRGRRRSKPVDGVLPGTVEVVERLGDRTHLHVRLTDGSLLVAGTRASAP